jgi:SAM-dependent methyltransferase
MLPGPMDNSTQTSIQEEQYHFPYHYVPVNGVDGFKLFVYWSWGINYLSALEFLIGKLETETFTTLLDVGCGDGRFLREVDDRLSGKELSGVDSSSRAISLAKALNPDLNFQAADIMEDRLPGDFDVVTLIEVLEHIPVDAAPHFLTAVSRLQQPGGRLYLTVPHTNRSVQKKHFQHFNRDTLSDIIEKHYEIREMFFFDRKSWHLKWLRGLMRNRLFILNHPRILNRIYSFYKKNLFLCSELECARFGIVAIKR